MIYHRYWWQSKEASPLKSFLYTFKLLLQRNMKRQQLTVCTCCLDFSNSSYKQQTTLDTVPRQECLETCSPQQGLPAAALLPVHTLCHSRCEHSPSLHLLLDKQLVLFLFFSLLKNLLASLPERAQAAEVSQGAGQPSYTYTWYHFRKAIGSLLPSTPCTLVWPQRKTAQ